MPGDSVTIIGLGAVLVLVSLLPVIVRRRKLDHATREAETVARKFGLHEPASLHPVVDPTLCIGCTSCIAICPEEHVLGLVDGQSRPVSPARCIGHGLCERTCPMEAIQLVFGTEKRGVDIPRIRENFETNVPGLYIIGELGGMGLIKNAFEQGRQCIEGIARETRGSPKLVGAATGTEGTGFLDVVIVGCGPAGLSAALECQERGLEFVVLEREDIGGTVRHYPRKKLVMTSPVTIPGYGKLSEREIRKEALMDIWLDAVRKTGLSVRSGETVQAVTPEPDGAGTRFTVVSDQGRYTARRVVLAIGRRGVPRKLTVPGEDLPKVLYSLREPEAYRDDRILVVGGGDSAIEAALRLAEQPGNEVRISYRKSAFSRIKPKNHEQVHRAVDKGNLEVLWSTSPVEITETSVALQNGGSSPIELPNDQLFVFIGGELPTGFLRACGVEIDTKFGQA